LVSRLVIKLSRRHSAPDRHIPVIIWQERLKLSKTKSPGDLRHRGFALLFCLVDLLTPGQICQSPRVR
jgi:hypothetical protein